MTRAITRTTWAFGPGNGRTYYFDGEEVKKAGGFLATPDGRLWKNAAQHEAEIRDIENGM